MLRGSDASLGDVLQSQLGENRVSSLDLEFSGDVFRQTKFCCKKQGFENGRGRREDIRLRVSGQYGRTDIRSVNPPDRHSQS